MRTLTALSLICLLAGCAATRTYEVSVKNDTGEPITIGLTKQGGPPEAKWLSPEDAALTGGEPTAQMWAAVPPGKVADTGKVDGKFDSGAVAVLRVYEGKLDLPGVMAVSRGQPNRMDIALHPGLNRFTIGESAEALTATRDEGPAATPMK